MPGPADDVPRWQPPEPADDAPRWEPPPPTHDVPRWEPPAAPVETVRRWEPASPAPRREPEPRASRREAEPVAPARAPLPAPGTLLGWPLSWWKRHPWAVVWALVLLAPIAVFFLRVLDESGYERALAPVGWGLAALFAASLVVALLSTARRSTARAALGVIGALGLLGILLWPLTRVTLDRTQCPARAGVDLGVPAAVNALASWERGEAEDGAWRSGVAPAWRDTVRGTRLIDYQLVDSGCWERVAPVDVTRTWHEFRVTVEAGGREPISKVVVVHTAIERGDWKITAVEGPLP